MSTKLTVGELKSALEEQEQFLTPIHLEIYLRYRKDGRPLTLEEVVELETEDVESPDDLIKEIRLADEYQGLLNEIFLIGEYSDRTYESMVKMRDKVIGLSGKMLDILKELGLEEYHIAFESKPEAQDLVENSGE